MRAGGQNITLHRPGDFTPDELTRLFEEACSKVDGTNGIVDYVIPPDSPPKTFHLFADPHGKSGFWRHILSSPLPSGKTMLNRMKAGSDGLVSLGDTFFPLAGGLRSYYLNEAAMSAQDILCMGAQLMLMRPKGDPAAIIIGGNHDPVQEEMEFQKSRNPDLAKKLFDKIFSKGFNIDVIAKFIERLPSMFRILRGKDGPAVLIATHQPFSPDGSLQNMEWLPTGAYVRDIPGYAKKLSEAALKFGGDVQTVFIFGHRHRFDQHGDKVVFLPSVEVDKPIVGAEVQCNREGVSVAVRHYCTDNPEVLRRIPSGKTPAEGPPVIVTKTVILNPLPTESQMAMGSLGLVIQNNWETSGPDWTRPEAPRGEVEDALSRYREEAKEYKSRITGNEIFLKQPDCIGQTREETIKEQIRNQYKLSTVNSKIAALESSLASGKPIPGAYVDIQLGDQEVYVVNDLHGNIEGLMKILNHSRDGQTILQKIASGKARLIFRGDIIHPSSGDMKDMGPSIKTIRYIFEELLSKYPNRVLLEPGDHEKVIGTEEEMLMKGDYNPVTGEYENVSNVGKAFRDQLIKEMGLEYTKLLQAAIDRLPLIIRWIDGNEVIEISGHGLIVKGGLTPDQAVGARFNPRLEYEILCNRPNMGGPEGEAFGLLYDPIKDATAMREGFGSENTVLGTGHQLSPDLTESHHQPAVGIVCGQNSCEYNDKLAVVRIARNPLTGEPEVSIENVTGNSALTGTDFREQMKLYNKMLKAPRGTCRLVSDNSNGFVLEDENFRYTVFKDSDGRWMVWLQEFSSRKGTAYPLSEGENIVGPARIVKTGEKIGFTWIPADEGMMKLTNPPLEEELPIDGKPEKGGGKGPYKYAQSATDVARWLSGKKPLSPSEASTKTNLSSIIGKYDDLLASAINKFLGKYPRTASATIGGYYGFLATFINSFLGKVVPEKYLPTVLLPANLSAFYGLHTWQSLASGVSFIQSNFAFADGFVLGLPIYLAAEDTINHISDGMALLDTSSFGGELLKNATIGTTVGSALAVIAVPAPPQAKLAAAALATAVVVAHKHPEWLKAGLEQDVKYCGSPVPFEKM